MSTTRDIIRQALESDASARSSVSPGHADMLAEAIADALEDAGYTIKKKPAPRTAKPTDAAEELIPTGDAALDTFIRTHHRPDWRKRLAKALQKTRPGMANMPTPPPGHAHKPMTQTERAKLWEAHRVQHHSS